jgi:hypothetical protein
MGILKWGAKRNKNLKKYLRRIVDGQLPVTCAIPI